MEASKLGHVLGIVELWSGQNEARFGPFETKIGSFCSISRDLSNGTLSNLGMFGDSGTLEGSK